MKKELLALVLFSLLFVGLASAGVLQVTNEHPFLINGNWIQAKQLQVGDLLTTWDGMKARITSIEQINEPVEVYNLEDDIFHNYVADGIIVHNSNSVDALVPKVKTIEVKKFKVNSRTLTYTSQTVEVAQNSLNNPVDWANIAKYTVKPRSAITYWDGVIYKDGTNFLYNPSQVSMMQIMIKILSDKGLIDLSKFRTYAELTEFIKENYGSDFLYVSFKYGEYSAYPNCPIPEYSLIGTQYEDINWHPDALAWTQWQVINRIPIKKSFFDYVKNKWAPNVKFSESDVPAQPNYLTRGAEAGWYAHWFNIVPD